MPTTAPRPPGTPGRPRLKERRKTPFPAPPAERTLGPRHSGKLEDKAHFIPVGHRLRLLRQETGLNQKDFALATLQDDPLGKGLTPYTVNRFENGVHSPRPRNAILLARTLSRLLGRRVRVSDLSIRDAEGLVDFLEEARQGREDVQTFYARLGISPERAKVLRAGLRPWTGPELGRVGVAFPDAADLVRDVLIAQARREMGLPAASGEATTKWDDSELPQTAGVRPVPSSVGNGAVTYPAGVEG
jgi:transcriptional regulator with XRE-family HTH domain